MKNQLIYAISLTVLLSSCKLADLRTDEIKKSGITAASEQKGRSLLAQTIAAQGYDQLLTHETYTIAGKDHWIGLMGKVGNPWPINDEQIRLQYITGTFDGRYQVLSGKKQGFTAGLQSWHYYEGNTPEALALTKTNENMKFIIAAFQYFFELPHRIQSAPIVSYAGKGHMDDKAYDLIFATWETTEPNKKYDQYLLWIDPQTHQLAFANYTLRESTLPFSQGIYGSIVFDDYRDIEGVMIPFVQKVYINDYAPGRAPLHKLTVSDFRFDAFPQEQLILDHSITPVGDSKPHITSK